LVLLLYGSIGWYLGIVECVDVTILGDAFAGDVGVPRAVGLLVLGQSKISH